jgi:adenylate cyclase
MENIRTAMNRGAFDFLTKPIDLDDLSITIQNARQVVVRERKADLVRSTFGRYLSDKIVSTLVDSPDGIKLGGEKRQVTMMISDLRGFSVIAEQIPPEQVVEVLNVYLGRMADIINAFDGTIDEFVGDAILAVFGAPVSVGDDARRAVACAIAMQLAMEDVNETLLERGFPPLEMGIGIHTGEVIVGNIGSHVRAKYGVVGSAVNLTSRIETYTVGGQVLVSKETLDSAGDEIDIRKQVDIRVKGFSEAVPVFEIGGLGEPFNLSLPVESVHPPSLPKPLAITYHALDGKHVVDEVCQGEFVAVDERFAIVRAPAGLDELANISLRLQGEELGVANHADIYAKVVEDRKDDNLYLLRFTGMPNSVHDVINNLSHS